MSEHSSTNRLKKYTEPENHPSNVYWWDQVNIDRDSLIQITKERPTIETLGDLIATHDLSHIENISIGDKITAIVTNHHTTNLVQGRVIQFVPKDRNFETVQFLALVELDKNFVGNDGREMIFIPLDHLKKV